MASPMQSPNASDRRQRLHMLATEWGISSLPPPSPLSPGSNPLSPSPTQHSPQDDRMADDLLRRRRQNAAPIQQSSSIRRAFTSSGNKKKEWEPKEVLEALNDHVANSGAPGVAQALIHKLAAAGGDLNGTPTQARPKLLKRRSMELPERSKVLAKAVENRQTDMVAVLLPHADTLALDNALPVALNNGDVAITDLLLRQGANAAQTADGQTAFRGLCAEGGQSDLVGLVLQSEGRPPSDVISQCMVDAAKKGDLDTVLRLSRSTADGNYMMAAALKEAISQSRVDVTLAILTGQKPPTGIALSQAFESLTTNSSIMPREKLSLAELLLCAGVSGDAVSAALVDACTSQFYEMVELLIKFGASVEYQDATVLRNAVSRGQTDLVQVLVNERSMLSSAYASQCVEHIPKRIAPEDRYMLLSTFLRKGATGPPLSDALIDAVEVADIDSASLLVLPQFPRQQSPLLNGEARNSRQMALDRHQVASVDHKEGLALQLAVLTSNVPLVKVLLAGSPSEETLAQVFPNVSSLSGADRYNMAEFLLSTGFTGPCVSTALAEAIQETPPARDEALIGLLLRANTDSSFNGGAGLVSAIEQHDVDILEQLLRGKPPPQVMAACLSTALAVPDRPIRLRIVSLLLQFGAGNQTEEVTTSLLAVVQTEPTDFELTKLLLTQGMVDVNMMEGRPLRKAARCKDPKLLELVLSNSRPTVETLNSALKYVASTPTDGAKLRKIQALLGQIKQQEPVNDLLVRETELLLKTPFERRRLDVIGAALSAGADVNAHKAAALCHAVRGADAGITDALLAAQPTEASLAAALPHAFHIKDRGHRLAFTKRLLEAGVPTAEAEVALKYALEAYSDDVQLLNVVATAAKTTDPETLLTGVKTQNPDVVNILVTRAGSDFSSPALGQAFQASMRIEDKGKRLAVARRLLKGGAHGAPVDDALLAAAADGDIDLGAVLMEHGVSAEHRDGQAVIEACRSGAAAVLQMLLSSKAEVTKDTLARGFQAATEVSDLGRRRDVFRQLLEKGVNGEVVDQQLISAVSFGNDGIDLVRLLLDYSASPDYKNGDAVWTATRCAFLESLKMMLGLPPVSPNQRKPAPATLLKSLKASWRLSKEPRFTVISWLFQAGLPESEDIHVALHKAVTDEPDARLIRLLLDHGASPLKNGCQTLIDVTQKLMLDILEMFLQKDIPQKDLNWAFSQSFTPHNADIWISAEGLEVIKRLIQKGARGEGLSPALSDAIEAYGTERDTVARQIAAVLIQAGADINGRDGIVLQSAARRGDINLIRQCFTLKPNSRTISKAFPLIFESGAPEDEILELMAMFADYSSGEDSLDAMCTDSESIPVVCKAIDLFPRSRKIVETLLDAGFYPDQPMLARVMPEVDEDEQVSLLFWALLQPQKRVSSSIIEMLIDRGANVNFETKLSKRTPIMLAVESRRQDIVQALILAKAEVDVTDITGNTPLTMATQIPGELGASMMSNILAAEPSRNDGSLHNAARELNLPAIKVLVEYGHDIDFPSPIHGGRSALGELCLHASDGGEMPAAREKQMEKTMAYFIDQGTDLELQIDGKSVLLLALDSAQPLPTTRALLKVGMWKHVNKPYNNYTHDNYVYSPTQYVARVLPKSDVKEHLMTLLKANRAIDTYYATDGPQPDGAVNLPDELLRADRERRAQLERMKSETEAHAISLARMREVATTENQLFVSRAQLEETKTARARADEVDAARERSLLADEAFAAELRRKNADRAAALAHERALTETTLTRERLANEAGLEWDTKKHEKMLEWENQLGTQRAGNEAAVSAIRVKERMDLDRVDAAADNRTRGRIAEQRKLVDSQMGLAQRLVQAGVGNGRGQIGRVIGELEQ